MVVGGDATVVDVVVGVGSTAALATPCPHHVVTATGQHQTTRDTGNQLGPLSDTYGSSIITPYDKLLFQDGKPFWIPPRAFAGAMGFPDSHSLYHNQHETIF